MTCAHPSERSTSSKRGVGLALSACLALSGFAGSALAQHGGGGGGHGGGGGGYHGGGGGYHGGGGGYHGGGGGYHGGGGGYHGGGGYRGGGRGGYGGWGGGYYPGDALIFGSPYYCTPPLVYGRGVYERGYYGDDYCN
jgi:hypothetical protein